MFEIILRDELAKNAAERFKEQYCHGENWTTYRDSPFWGRQPEQMYADLLKAKGNVAKVEAILGDANGWTRMFCQECYTYVDVGVAIQEDYETGAEVCLPCLTKMLQALQKASQQIAV